MLRKIPSETHHIHVGVAQLRDISQLLDDVPLGVNTTLRIAGTTASRAVVIRGLRQNLPTLHNDGHMEMCVVAITEPLRARIIKKLLKDAGLRKMCHAGCCLLYQRLAAILSPYTKCIS